ncbi:hypothetical protein JGU66_14055 [Myxococcaceae bacterium JPH2]|nr:hypothetical protein [Myxococcaceae bacterium JPH2]
MRTDSSPPLDLLREYKVRASLLLKDLLVDDAARATRAAERLRQLPQFAELSAPEVLARKDSVLRKHALGVIAQEQGHPSWSALKETLEQRAPSEFDTEVFFARPPGAFLNRWFGTYAKAAASLRTEGGFLFPFRTQFFICDAGFLRALGADPDDPDWERMGRDWVAPRDVDARGRLTEKLAMLNLGGRHGVR